MFQSAWEMPIITTTFHLILIQFFVDLIFFLIFSSISNNSLHNILYCAWPKANWVQFSIFHLYRYSAVSLKTDRRLIRGEWSLVNTHCSWIPDLMFRFLTVKEEIVMHRMTMINCSAHPADLQDTMVVVLSLHLQKLNSMRITWWTGKNYSLPFAFEYSFYHRDNMVDTGIIDLDKLWNKFKWVYTCKFYTINGYIYIHEYVFTYLYTASSYYIHLLIYWYMSSNYMYINMYGYKIIYINTQWWGRTDSVLPERSHTTSRVLIS